MRNTKTLLSACVLGLTASAAVLADHNSPWGEGWANMPNDIHNTRLDTRDDDNDDFIDFVRAGMGADSENRFLSDIDTTTGSDRGQGSGGARGGRS